MAVQYLIFHFFFRFLNHGHLFLRNRIFKSTCQTILLHLVSRQLLFINLIVCNFLNISKLSDNQMAVITKYTFTSINCSACADIQKAHLL